jgi:hypothetical protein
MKVEVRASGTSSTLSELALTVGQSEKKTLGECRNNIN